MTLEKLNLIELNAQEMKEVEGGNAVAWLIVAVAVIAVVAYYEANRNAER